MTRYAGLVLGALAGLLWQAPPLAAQELAWAPVEYRAAPERRAFEGTVVAVRQATVSAQAAGRVREVLFDVDDFVPAGAVIVRLRGKEQRAGLEASQASVREAQARLGRAEDEYQRVRRIFAQRLVAQSALDEARAERDAARARLDAALAELARAEEQLDYTEVRAPYAGVVVQRFVEVGESVTPGQPLMAGLSLDELRVELNVPQRELAALQPGLGAAVLGPGGEEIAVEAESITVLPVADPRSHTVRVRLELPPGSGPLAPGMLVKALFAAGERRRLLIPESALVRRSEVVGVYVLGEDGRVRLRQVRTGRVLAPGRIEVLAGLSEGERVALDPHAAALALKRAAGD